jgi:hypothetical protein
VQCRLRRQQYKDNLEMQVFKGTVHTFYAPQFDRIQGFPAGSFFEREVLFSKVFLAKTCCKAKKHDYFSFLYILKQISLLFSRISVYILLLRMRISTDI